jgi:hypothetical protein
MRESTLGQEFADLLGGDGSTGLGVAQTLVDNGQRSHGRALVGSLDLKLAQRLAEARKCLKNQLTWHFWI